MRYEDMIIEASDAEIVRTVDKRRLGKFKVRVLESPAGEMTPEQAVVVTYDHKALQATLLQLEKRNLDRAGIIDLGRVLALLLLPPKREGDAVGIRDLFATSLAQMGQDRGLRLRLRLPPFLSALPWEYIYVDRAGGGEDMDGFLALDPHVVIIRHEALPSPAPLPLIRGEIKVVVALASAMGLPPLDLSSEKADLEKAFESIGGLNPVFIEDATLDEVQAAIPDAGIFHFAGHGIFTRQMGDLPGTYTGTGALALDDRQVEAEQLGINLRGNGVRLAMLGGCETGRRDGVNVWGGIAPALTKAGIPAVVAHQYSILDKSAIAFSRQFYQALVGGLPIERAMAAGRIAAYNTDPNGRDWGVPVLYLRAENGQLFGGAADEAVRQQARMTAEADVNVRVREVAVGGKVVGAEVREMLAGRLGVTVVVDGIVYGKVIGATFDRLRSGKTEVNMDIDEIGEDGSVTGLKLDQLGREKIMDDAKITVNQDVGAVKGKAKATGVEINVYSYFKARPAHLRRSFDVLIKNKLQGFVGRKFVFDALDSFLLTNESGYFIIRGVCGIGKSALLAKLVNERGYIHHFNIASQNIRNTRIFLENVCAQLIARYELDLEIPHQAFDDSGFLMQCLGDAASNSNNHPIVVIIDALDEVDRLGLAPTVNILYLPPALPKGVYIVATTRNIDDMHLRMISQQTLDLQADSAGNLRDISTYIERYSQREKMRARLSAWGVSDKQFVAGLRTKSQGNFMYLRYVLPAIEEGRFVEGTLNELPEGLMAYYRVHWRKMKSRNKHAFDRVYEPIVCILGVAQEPVTTQQIANWTKLERGQVKGSLRLWREFLEEEKVEGERRYRIYHASFQDFLKEQVDLAQYDDMIADYYLALAGLE